MRTQHVENNLIKNINPKHSINFMVRSRRVFGKFNVARVCTSGCYEMYYKSINL
jgi:hypothetical protein